MRRDSIHWPVLPLVLALSACGGGGDAAPEPAKPAAVTLSLAADEATLAWNKASSLKVLANDSASRGALSLSAVSTPAHGTAKISGSEIEYTPSAGYVGTDTFNYTAQGDDGTKASVAVTLKINAALLLKGVVSDGPIANALVTATLGAKSFTTSADALGAYTLALQTDNLSDALSLSASGVGTQSMVKLQSLLGDVAALAKLADKDGLLSPAQSPAVQVTHYSTALAALVTESNGDKAPTSLALLDELAVAASGERLIELATAIKLVVDKGVALPAGVTDTAALVAKPSTAAALAAFLKQQQALPVYASTRTEVLAGPVASAGPLFAPTAARTQLYFLAELGRSHLQRIEYRPDGSASLLDSSGTREAKWVAKAGEIEVTPLTPISVTSLSAGVDASGQQFEIRYDTLGYRFKQLSGSADRGQVLLSSRAREEVLSGSNKGQISDKGWSEGAPVSSQDLPSLQPVVAADVAVGARLAGMLVEAELRPNGLANSADILAINGANTARLEISGTALTWRIEDGQFVTLSPDGTERHYAKLREIPTNGVLALMVTDYSKGKPQRSITTLSARIQSPLVFKADASLFKRWQHGFAVPPLYYDIQAGGGAQQITVDAAGKESAVPMTWSLGAAGQLKLLRGSGAAQRTREWLLLNQRDANITVLERTLNAQGGPEILWRLASYTAAGNSAGAAPNTLAVSGGESYPLRVFFTLDAAGQITGGDYDFHKLDGTMTPCEVSPANQASCHGASASVSKSSQGASLSRSSGTASATSLVVGPDAYGYSFTGTITGLEWVGTWSKVATPNSSLVQTGSFAVKVGIR